MLPLGAAIVNNLHGLQPLVEGRYVCVCLVLWCEPPFAATGRAPSVWISK